MSMFDSNDPLDKAAVAFIYERERNGDTAQTEQGRYIDLYTYYRGVYGNSAEADRMARLVISSQKMERELFNPEFLARKRQEEIDEYQSQYTYEETVAHLESLGIDPEGALWLFGYGERPPRSYSQDVFPDLSPSERDEYEKVKKDWHERNG